MTAANSLEVVHELFNNLKEVMNGAPQVLILMFQTIDYTCLTRRQGIDSRHTTGSRYVQTPWNVESN